MMIYKDTKAMVHSHDSHSNLFDIVDEVMQEDTLAHILLLFLKILSDPMKENDFIHTKKENNLTRTNTNADYADYLVLLVNTPDQVYFLMYNLERSCVLM